MTAKYVEPTALQLDLMSRGRLREEYDALLIHHVDETSELHGRLGSSNRGPSVIVIGPDQVGKTTTVRHLSQMLRIPSFKCPAEKRIFKEGGRSSLAFDYTLTHFLGQTGYRFISDRGYPCEWTYSRVFGRETDDQLLGLIDSGHAHIGTRILYLYSSVPPFEEDDLVPPERYDEVRRTYDRFVEWTSCRVTSVDVAEMLLAFNEGSDISKSVAEKCIERIAEHPDSGGRRRGGRVHPADEGPERASLDAKVRRAAEGGTC